MKDIVNFLFEVGMLARTPRSFCDALGTGKQSVSEHTLRVIFVGYALANMYNDIDVDKVIKMCLLHDLAEARTSDLNYIHQMYAEVDEKRAIEDLTKTLPFGEGIKSLLNEYEERKTKESIIAKDADTLEFLLFLKEQSDQGNKRADTWTDSAIKRLKSVGAQQLAEQILKTDSDSWWFTDKDGDWWVNRDKEKLLGEEHE